MPERHIRNIRNKAQSWKRKAARKMSRNKTWPEKILWARLKESKLGVAFHSQKIVLGYILDFYCPRAGLCVEVDGPCHLTQKEYDAHRDVALMQKGILTMRFTAQEVNNNTNAVVALINDKMRKRMA